MLLKFEESSNRFGFPSLENEMSNYTGINEITTDADDTVTINEGSTITFSPRQNDKGGVYIGSSNNDIVINVPGNTYGSQSDLIATINSEIQQHPILAGTEFNGSTNRVNIKFNINKIYTTKDYRIVFYDIYSFSWSR